MGYEANETIKTWRYEIDRRPAMPVLPEETCHTSMYGANA